MQEGDQLAASAIEGLFVNQPHARARGLFELAFDVVGAEGDVMDAAGRILFEELGDRAFRVGGLEQFEMHFADGKERGAHLLRGDFFAVFAFQAEGFFVIGDGLVQ